MAKQSRQSWGLPWEPVPGEAGADIPTRLGVVVDRGPEVDMPRVEAAPKEAVPRRVYIRVAVEKFG